MRPRLIVSADSAGQPFAQVPVDSMWDLVEHLSYQRTAVNYQYEATHFKVTFTRQDVAAAQRILDQWTASPMQLLQTAG